MNSSFLIKITMLLILFGKNIEAQNKNDTILAFKYYQKANSLLIEKNIDEAISLFDNALTIYQLNKTWKQVAICLNKLSESYLEKGNLDLSREHAEKALMTYKRYRINSIDVFTNILDQIGLYHQKNGEFEQALDYHSKALEIRKKNYPEDSLFLAFSYQNLGLLQAKKSNYSHALNYYKKALRTYEKELGEFHYRTGTLQNQIGIIYYYTGAYDKALRSWRKSLSINKTKFGENHYNTALAHKNIGIIYRVLQQLEEASKHYNKAISIFKDRNKKSDLSVTYNNLGNVHRAKGENEKALDYYMKGVNLQSNLQNKNVGLIAGYYNNIGITLKNLKNYKEALKYHKEALKIREKFYGKQHLFVAHSINNIAQIYHLQKQYNKAFEYYQLTLDLLKVIFNSDNYEFIDVYLSFGDTYKEMGEYDKALDYYQKTLLLISKLYYKDHIIILPTLNKLAELYLLKGDYNEAIKYCEKALSINAEKSMKKMPLNQQLYKNLPMYLMTVKTKVTIAKLQFDQHKDLDQLKISIQACKQADYVIRNQRNNISDHQDKIAFAKEVKNIFSQLIENQYTLYQSTKDSLLLFEAFEYSEKSKANTLKNLLTTTRAKNFAGLSKETLLLEQHLKTNLAFYTSNITNQLQTKNPDTAKIRFYENKIFDITRKQDSLTNFLEQNHPNYYRLKYKNTFLTVPEIQERLSNNTTILEFFTTDSVTYAFTLNKNNINISKIVTPNITQKIQHFREHITSKNIIDYKNNAESLYATLIKPIVHQLKGDELIIVPDGPLWHLNFDLLLTKESTSKDPKQLPYMLRDYAISYANSVNVLFSKNYLNKNSKLLQECLAFSFSDNTQITDSESLSFNMLRNADADLPGTREEISAISEIVNGQYYYGAQAIEKNFKKTAHQYNILHLALHGEVDNEHPENSKLYFTKSNDSIEDDLLYSHELFALDIPAELVVLSACNTGTGKIAEGEGIMSLGNAFQYAGSKSLLLTNWEVPDQNTPEIMRNFYTHLSSKMSKSKALQQAKLNYLKNADITRSHPFYWGSFYILGDNKAIDLQTPSDISKTITWFVLLILVLCLTYFILKRRKKLSKK